MKLDATRVKITTQPAVEPVTATEAKLHLRIDHSTEDALVERLIEAARVACEAVAQRAFITRTYTAKLDRWPADGRFVLPFPPLLTVTSVSYTDEDGNTTAYSSGNYTVDTHSEPGQIVLKSTAAWPTVTLADVNGVSIIYTAGYGAATTDVPEPYRQAILLLVGHLYENRESVVVGQGISITELPLAANWLLMMDRGGWQ